MPIFSAAQKRILEVVARFEREEQPALVPDLVKSLGLAAESSLTPTLRILQREGWIEVGGGGAQGRSRVIRLTARGRFTTSGRGLPLLGTIPAGLLSEALAQPEEIVEDRDLLPSQPGDFLLQVQGDSMTGDGIFDGDRVLLRPEVEWRQGEIAAVLVGTDHQATLKRVFREGEMIRLQPSNPRFSEVLVSAQEVKIAGVFRGLVRHAGRR